MLDEWDRQWVGMSHGEIAKAMAPYPANWAWKPRVCAEHRGSGTPVPTWDRKCDCELPRVLNAFSGPGGWEWGIYDVLGAYVDMAGIEKNKDATATARAAGRWVVHSDITLLDPKHPGVRWVVGYIVSAPCQGWTPVGKRAGRDPKNQQLLLEIFARAYEVAFGHRHGPGLCGNKLCSICQDDPEWVGDSPYTGSPYTLTEVRSMYEELTDPRLGLIAEALIWPLILTAEDGGIQWIAMEQSHELPEIVLGGLRDQLRAAGWFDVQWQVINAKDIGLASSRPRVFMIAFRHKQVDLSGLAPKDEFVSTSAAKALKWPAGIVVNTRGDRTKGGTIKPKGGNGWSADKAAGSITSKFRNWYWESDKNRAFSLDEGALLVGFDVGYPWTGSRTSCTQQIGDVVSPIVAAMVIGVLLGIPWEQKVRAYLCAIYKLKTTYKNPADLNLAA